MTDRASKVGDHPEAAAAAAAEAAAKVGPPPNFHLAESVAQPAYTMVADREGGGVFSQICTKEYMFVLSFGYIMNTRATLFLGLLNNFLVSDQFKEYPAAEKVRSNDLSSCPDPFLAATLNAGHQRRCSGDIHEHSFCNCAVRFPRRPH
eukprot:SAG11_NODE_9136_length_939_cov_1.395238_1_plen_148_part_10